MSFGLSASAIGSSVGGGLSAYGSKKAAKAGSQGSTSRVELDPRMQGILYGVNSIEPVVLVTAPLILLAASLLASYIPALRAMRVNPTVALRTE